MFMLNQVAEFCMRWSFCFWWREIVFSGTVGKVNIIVVYSFKLLCIVRDLNFGSLVNFSLAENVRGVM